MRPDSVRNIKIQHHTDLREHLGQMFIITLKLLSLWKNRKRLIVEGDMGSFISVRCHWVSFKMVLLKTLEHKGCKSRLV